MVMFVGLLRFAGPSETLDSWFTARAQREDYHCVSFHIPSSDDTETSQYWQIVCVI